MIEWIIAVAGGIFFVMIAYSFAFIFLQIVAKRSESVKKIISSKMWMSNLIIGPILIQIAFTAIMLNGWMDLAAWGWIFPDFYGLMIVVTVGLASAFVILLPSTLYERRKGFTETQMPKGKTEVAGFIILVIIGASIAEELLFRGLLQQLIDNSLLFAFSIDTFVVTSGNIIAMLVFGLIHIMPAKQMKRPVAPMVLGAFALSFVAGVSLTVLGSLLAPIIIHAEFNAVGLILSKFIRPTQTLE